LAALSLLFSSVSIAPALAAPLFEDDAVLELRLSGPLRTVVREKKDHDPEEYPFTLTVGDAEIPVDVRVRGKSRTKVCPFPPLRFDFSSEDTGGTIFDGQDKLKLVTHCRSDRENFENNLLEEYTAYRIFNTISDISYRVRLLRIQYEDTDGKVKDIDRPYYAFLIESDEELAQRTGSSVAELQGVPYSRLNAEQTARFYIFHYLIGNFDWSFVIADDAETCCHNVDLLERDDELYPVPYDFDMAGIVNSPYAHVPDGIGIRRATQRVYRGYCKLEMEKVAVAFDEITALRDDIMPLVRNSPVAGDEDTSSRERFIGYFFEQAIEGRDEMLEEFDSDCLGPR
jgi:hypothetical protein